MAAYRLFFKKAVEGDMEALGTVPILRPRKKARKLGQSPPRVRDLKKILNRIKALAEDPRPAGCEKLTGQERYRLRQGRYRIVYSIQDDELTIWVVKIGHRKDIYR
jgi:mRNA interferase RelE/StbE